MVRFGNFEVEYNRNAPDKVSVRIETDDKGEVWLPKCDIARAYGVFVQSVNAGLKSLAKTGDFDEYRDVRVEHFTYNGKNCSVEPLQSGNHHCTRIPHEGTEMRGIQKMGCKTAKISIFFH